MPPALTLAPPAPTSIEPLQTRIYLPSELTLNFAGKFLEQYVSLKDVPGPCWVWTAGATQKGYGMVGDLGPSRRGRPRDVVAEPGRHPEAHGVPDLRQRVGPSFRSATQGSQTHRTS